VNGEQPGAEALATIAQALGVTPRACEKILREEQASLADAQEALRRIVCHRAYRSGAIRSPGAFFRGVLRRVQDDRAATVRLQPAPAPPPAAKQSAQPASPLGRAYLRAYHLLASGTSHSKAFAVLRQDFPEAPADLLDLALTWAKGLRSSERSQLP